jgi:osmoprotectant transport system ATP-binding protein
MVPVSVSDSCIEFIEVSKSFGSTSKKAPSSLTKVLNDISLQLPGDVTTALVGESGSGKSTLLQLINGLVVPDTGAVLVHGEPVNYDELPVLRRTMGYAVQGAGLFPHLTVEQNITLVARLNGWDGHRVAERVESLFGLLGLDMGFRERFPHELSGGQQQRISLCRAMMLDPPLMLLDEPFSALDPITRNDIHREFIALQAAEPRSTVLVTHDMQEAVKLARYLVILRNGEVVQSGAVDEVAADPVDEYVDRLFAVGSGDAS